MLPLNKKKTSNCSFATKQMHTKTYKDLTVFIHSYTHTYDIYIYIYI